MGVRKAYNEYKTANQMADGMDLTPDQKSEIDTLDRSIKTWAVVGGSVFVGAIVVWVFFAYLF